MANSDVCIGDVVQLSAKHGWSSQESNPIGVDAKVYDIEDGWIYVHFDNGVSNAYRVKDSDLIVQGGQQ